MPSTLIDMLKTSTQADPESEELADEEREESEESEESEEENDEDDAL